jgi:hypothetical protein
MRHKWTGHRSKQDQEYIFSGEDKHPVEMEKFAHTDIYTFSLGRVSCEVFLLRKKCNAYNHVQNMRVSESYIHTHVHVHVLIRTGKHVCSHELMSTCAYISRSVIIHDCITYVSICIYKYTLVCI